MIFCVRCVFIVNAAQYLGCNSSRYWEWLTTTKSPTEQSKETFGKTRKVVTSKKNGTKSNFDCCHYLQYPTALLSIYLGSSIRTMDHLCMRWYVNLCPTELLDEHLFKSIKKTWTDKILLKKVKKSFWKHSADNDLEQYFALLIIIKPIFFPQHKRITSKKKFKVLSC